MKRETLLCSSRDEGFKCGRHSRLILFEGFRFSSAHPYAARGPESSVIANCFCCSNSLVDALSVVASTQCYRISTASLNGHSWSRLNIVKPSIVWSPWYERRVSAGVPLIHSCPSVGSRWMFVVTGRIKTVPSRLQLCDDQPLIEETWSTFMEEQFAIKAGTSSECSIHLLWFVDFAFAPSPSASSIPLQLDGR